MPDHRTPEETLADILHRSRVRAVLDQAVVNGASYLVAVDLGEPVEPWCNTLWNGLRDGLSDDHPKQVIGGRTYTDEDRLMAIVMLLEDRMRAEADKILAGVRQNRRSPMNAVTTVKVRAGETQGWSAAEEPYVENAGEEPVYAHVLRHGLRVYWRITCGSDVLAGGRTWTKGGAWVQVCAAAHRPSLRGGRS